MVNKFYGRDAELQLLEHLSNKGSSSLGINVGKGEDDFFKMIKGAKIEFIHKLESLIIGGESDVTMPSLKTEADLGVNLAYIAPIRKCVNVLSKQIQGIKTNPIKYPNMPIIVKTPMCKTIVQQPSEQGGWHFDRSQNSMVARHINSGKLNGFVLMDEGLSLRANFLREMT